MPAKGRPSRSELALLAAGLLLAAVVPAAGWCAPRPIVTNVNDEVLPGPRVTVVTFNVLHGFGSRLNDDTLDDRLLILQRELERERPDVVILQEASVSSRHGNVVDRLRDALNASLQPAGISYNSAQLMANGSALISFFEGSAILSRARVQSADDLVYRAQALIPPERRVALRVRLQCPAGDVVVAGTHLTNTDARRQGELIRTRQARELAAWMAGDSPATLTVVGGDLNDSPDSATLAALRQAGARDAWAEALARGAAVGSGLTGLTGTVRDAGDAADQRIDYLLVFGTTGIVDAAEPFLGAPGSDSSGRLLWASDHVGVKVGLSIP